MMMVWSRSVARVLPQIRQIHAGCGSVVAGPPSTPVSTMEKAGHALFMFVVTTALPAYVLVKIPEYRGLK